MRVDASALRELLREADAPPHLEAQRLPAKVRYRSGRVLTLAEGPDAERDSLLVTSPDGRVELTVRFTASGPVLSFDGARLALGDVSELELSCDRLRLSGEKGIELRSGASVVVRAEGDVHLDGENVMINCEDRALFRR